jgi:hypothetical protein
MLAMSPQKHGGGIAAFNLASQRAVRHYIARATDRARPVNGLRHEPPQKKVTFFPVLTNCG